MNIHRREWSVLEFAASIALTCALAALTTVMVYGGYSWPWIAATAVLWFLSALWTYDNGQYLQSVMRDPWRALAVSPAGLDALTSIPEPIVPPCHSSLGRLAWRHLYRGEASCVRGCGARSPYYIRPSDVVPDA